MDEDQFAPSFFFDLAGFAHRALFEECRWVWQALEAMEGYFQKIALGKIEVSLPNGVFLERKELISIGKGTRIEPGAYIRGPCLIGKNCEVRHGAYIRGEFISGDGCVIGHDTEIKKAIFFNEAKAGHFAYIGDSILGNGANLGAGTKCANLRLDHQPIAINYGNKKIATGCKKLGAILGDNTQTGCNSVLNPGTLCGKGVLCHPCVAFGGFIPPHHVVKLESKVRIFPCDSSL